MRETITIAVCLLLVFAGLQTGFLRTGLEYDGLQKKMETQQMANDRLSAELKLAPGAVAGSAQPQIDELKAELEHYRSNESGPNQKIQEQKTQWLKLFDRETKDGDLEIHDDDNILTVVSRDKALFQGETEKINPAAKVWLMKLAQAVKEQKDTEIRILGHTDLMLEGKNLADKNMRARLLALNRVQVLGDFLDMQGGVDPVQIVAATCGSNRPLVANDSEYHRAQNRRFEFLFTSLSPHTLSQARKISRFEKQLATTPAPKVKPAKAREISAGEDESQPLGAEALDQSDSTSFKGGYEKPKE